jgi:hypothetical protein
MAPQDKSQYMPWPTEGAMRSGILFMMGGSMSGVGDIGKLGDGTLYFLFFFWPFGLIFRSLSIQNLIFNLCSHEIRTLC